MKTYKIRAVVTYPAVVVCEVEADSPEQARALADKQCESMWTMEGPFEPSDLWGYSLEVDEVVETSGKATGPIDALWTIPKGGAK